MPIADQSFMDAEAGSVVKVQGSNPALKISGSSMEIMSD
jgi:hypothetical protein